MASRSTVMRSWGVPVTCSRCTSVAPSTPAITPSMAAAVRSRTSWSGPKIFTASSALAPVISSSTAMAMGWAKLNCTPGNASKAWLIFSYSSSWVAAEVHSAWGFRATKDSAELTAWAWAPTSPCPTRVTTRATSGNSSMNRPSNRSMVSRASSSEIDGAMVARTIRSPSFILGTNSDPRRGSTHNPAATMVRASATAAARKRTKNRTRGR